MVLKHSDGEYAVDLIERNEAMHVYSSCIDKLSSGSFYFFTNLIHLVFFTILAYLSLHF